ncbi:MAG: molecular chaperone TorD family protein [Coriobacteriales bacterium]|jgi:TorA maturation chaperone TorD|nr:molecular chaperone TorD family protein [Coriobacteriales bacterium]
MDAICKELLENEQAFFTLMAKVLIEAPNSQLMETLRASEAFLGIPFAEHQQDCQEGLAVLRAWSEDSPEAIDEEYQDYLALFGVVGKPLASPWESSYLNDAPGFIFQIETLEVRAWYERFGMQVRKKYQEPDDNIVYEFEFICHLAGEALQAYAAKDEEGFARFWDAQKDFLHEHLLKWGLQWCDRVFEYAKTKFYKGIARLVKGSLRELADVFEGQTSR